jgi:hypothetical protein
MRQRVRAVPPPTNELIPVTLRRVALDGSAAELRSATRTWDVLERAPRHISRHIVLLFRLRVSL